MTCATPGSCSNRAVSSFAAPITATTERSLPSISTGLAPARFTLSSMAISWSLLWPVLSTMIIKVLRLERRSGKSAMPKGGARRRLPDAGELLELRERRVVLLQALLQGLRSRLRVEVLKKLRKSDGDVVQVQISALAVLEEV